MFGTRRRCRTIELLENILEELRHLSTSIVTRDQFDAALTGAVTTIKTALDDLLAAVAAGKVVSVEDFTNELTTLQGIVAGAVTADPGPQTVTPAPGS